MLWAISPKKQLWVAAAQREQSIALVLAELPIGWSAALVDLPLSAEEVSLMQPGDVRKLTR
jgi:hypothetical protein